jgi:hypothetical protein
VPVIVATDSVVRVDNDRKLANLFAFRPASWR